ncbi:DTW domain-containing protein 1 [Chytridiales sp. JEL 0842]|nr:DTW domain-containing protein 1 [Chytridiales sp. JEL 0842]
MTTQSRVACPQCKKSYKTYCPRCCLPLDHVPPKVELPLPIDIYRHPNELEGKTTSVHTKILAPDQTNLYVDHFTQSAHPDLLSRYPHPHRTLLLFPSEDSLPLSHIDRSTFDRLVVIDGTWKQARSMCWSLQPHGFRPVRLEGNYKTLFWRFQKYGDYCLSTVEAIYYFYQEFDEAYEGGAKSRGGGFDNLLYYFKAQYVLIQGYYRQNAGKTFTRKKLDAASYIKYEKREEEGGGGDGNGEEMK